MSVNNYGFAIVHSKAQEDDAGAYHIIARYNDAVAASIACDHINELVTRLNGILSETIERVRVIRWWTPERYASAELVNQAETFHK